MMNKLLTTRYSRIFFAWLSLSIYLLLAIVVLIAIETLSREYPKWHWWMATIPVNVFNDAYLPVLKDVIYIFSLPIGITTLLPIISNLMKWKKANRIIEIFSYILAISLLWFSFWFTGFRADCQLLSLESDGGPWGQCGYWASNFISLETYVIHTIIWVIWSTTLIKVWTYLKGKILTN